MKKFLFCLVLSCGPFFGFSQTFILKEKIIHTDLQGYVYTASNLKIHSDQELIKHKNDFKKEKGPMANFGQNSDTHYLYFDIKNQNKENIHLALFLDQVHLSTADFYLFENDLFVHKIAQRDSDLLTSKPVNEHNFIYPFQLKPNRHYSVFLKIKANPQNATAKGFVKLFDQNSLNKYLRVRNLKFGFLFGLLAFSLAVGVILFLIIQKKLYLIYSFYIFTILLLFGLSYGFIKDLLPSIHMAKTYQSFLMISSFGHLLFIRAFLRFDLYFSKTLNLISLLLSFVFLALGLANLLLPISTFMPYLTRPSLVIGILLLVIIAFFSKKRKDKAAKIYLLAMLPGLVIIFYLLIGSIGFFDIWPQTYNLLYISPIFEITVFGFGLVYMANLDRIQSVKELEQVKFHTAAAIINAQEDERRQIAQDLHDDLGSTLSILKSKLSFRHSEHLDLTKELTITDQAVDDLRNISHSLMPTLLLKKGLKQAILDSLADYANPSIFRFNCSGIERGLAPDRILSVYRIVKELINNAIKHAQATKIEVQLIYFEDFLYVSVEDNGKGFDENETKGKGIGLKNIHLRVSFLNGQLSKESSSKGSLLSLEVPYEDQSNSSRRPSAV